MEIEIEIDYTISDRSKHQTHQKPRESKTSPPPFRSTDNFSTRRWHGVGGRSLRLGAQKLQGFLARQAGIP
jgi:hypothetical protein